MFTVQRYLFFLQNRNEKNDLNLQLDGSTIEGNPLCSSTPSPSAADLKDPSHKRVKIEKENDVEALNEKTRREKVPVHSIISKYYATVRSLRYILVIFFQMQ